MDMRTFKLSGGDLIFDADRNISFVTGDDEIAQALERAFTTNAGEWFLNANHGLEYPQIQGKKGLKDEIVQIAIIKCALQDTRIKEIINIDIQRNVLRRTINIKFTCKVDTGAVITVPFSFE
jgi:hypothetical protein